MSYESPILTAGLSSNQTIWESVSDPRHPVGTRGQLNDGRSFYYSCNRSSAIDAGNLLGSAPISVDFDDLATNTALEGDTTVNVTPVGTQTYALNELEGGFLSVNSGAAGNNGRQYRISSNPATSAATAFDLVLEAVREEDFVAATTGTVVPNMWSAVVVAPTGASMVVGATTFDVGAGSSTPQYFWAQTWGQATILAGAAGDIIGHLLEKGTGGAGETLGTTDTGGTSDVIQVVGVNMFTSVDADYMPVFLQIAP